MSKTDSYREIPAGNELQYIARKVSGISTDVAVIKNELKHTPTEDRVRQITEEIVTQRIELLKAEISKRTPRGQIMVPEHLIKDPLLHTKNWRGIARIISLIAALIGVGAGTGYTVKITNDSTDKTVEKGD